MANLKRLPGVTATKTKRGRRRRSQSKGGLRNWWRVIKFALIVKRIRSRRERSSPPVRQIVLVAVTGGVAIVIIRGASRRAMAAKRARSADDETQDQAPAPEAPSEQTTPGVQDGLTERVRVEMFENEN